MNSISNSKIINVIFIVDKKRRYSVDVEHDIPLQDLKKIISKSAKLSNYNLKLYYEGKEIENEIENLDTLFPNCQKIEFTIVVSPKKLDDFDQLIKIYYPKNKFCSLHKGKYPYFYCHTCKKSICFLCTKENTHLNHDYIEKYDYLQSSRVLTDQLFQSIDENLLPFSNQFNELKEKIANNFFPSLIKLIKKIENKLYELIENLSCDENNNYEKIKNNILCLKSHCAQGLDELKNEINIEEMMLDESIFLIFDQKFKKIGDEKNLLSNQIEEYNNYIKQFNCIEKIITKIYNDIYSYLDKYLTNDIFSEFNKEINNLDIPIINKEKILKDILGDVKKRKKFKNKKFYEDKLKFENEEKTLTLNCVDINNKNNNKDDMKNDKKDDNKDIINNEMMNEFSPSDKYKNNSNSNQNSDKKENQINKMNQENNEIIENNQVKKYENNNLNYDNNINSNIDKNIDNKIINNNNDIVENDSDKNNNFNNSIINIVNEDKKEVKNLVICNTPKKNLNKSEFKDIINPISSSASNITNSNTEIPKKLSNSLVVTNNKRQNINNSFIIEYNSKNNSKSINLISDSKYICQPIENTNYINIYNSDKNIILKKEFQCLQEYYKKFPINCAWYNYNNFLYISGGEFDNKELNYFMRYDPENNILEKLEDLPDNSIYHSMCIDSNENMYIIGGKNKHIFKYNIIEKKFSILKTELIEKRKRPICFCYREFIFILFGIDLITEKFLDTFEKLNLKKNSIFKIKTNYSLIYGTILQKNKRDFYIFGGKNKDGIQKGSLKLDIEVNAINKGNYKLNEANMFHQGVLPYLGGDLFGNFIMDGKGTFTKINLQ